MINYFPKKGIIIFLLIIYPLFSWSQLTPSFYNPSFEDEPRKGSYYSSKEEAQRNNIEGWYDCGVINFPAETAPDIHSDESDYWNLLGFPTDGKTYLGLVVRDNNTWESVSQKLDEYLYRDSCYSFTIDISMSNSYLSGSRLQRKVKPMFSYNNPSILAIWAGDIYCDEKELIFESPPIDHEEWKTYEVVFQTNSNVKHITFQAYYSIDDEDDPKNGNILLDNISEISVIKCNR